MYYNLVDANRVIKMLEQDKRDLQLKLIDARSCAKCSNCNSETCKNIIGNNSK